MARGPENVSGGLDMLHKARVIEMRRCILLAIVGSTSSSSASLQRILKNGYLIVVKSWLDDILNSAVGGVDLLLHLLSSISMLPVTKEMVTTSKLGKAVAAVEKHTICTGSKNEGAIKMRISKVKEQWSASVKVMKQSASSSKRQLDYSTPNSLSASKRAKTEDQVGKKDTSISNLLKRVSGNDNSRAPSSAQTSNALTNGNGNAISAAEAARLRSQERDAKLKARLKTIDQPIGTTAENNMPEDKAIPTKNKHIKWADNAGGELLISHQLGNTGEEILTQGRKDGSKQEETRGSASWTDRRKKDRLREKELLERARKSKIVDKEDSLDAMTMMVIPWHHPMPLPPDPQNPPAQVNSNEYAAQVTRMASVLPSNYLSEEDVPKNPTSLSDIEQALDITSISSSVPMPIPFYAPEPETTAAPVSPAPVQPHSVVAPAPAPVVTSLPPPPPPPPVAASGATIETLQAMGLPVFLVGSNMQALQTLAASPSLLNTFRDVNGMYDQARLMALVQTLTMNLAPSQPVQQISQNQAQSMPSSTVPGGAGFQSHANSVPPPPQYGAASTYQASPQPMGYGGFQSTQGAQGTQNSHDTDSSQGSQRGFPGKGYRGDQNGTDGNLHISGYGPATTQAEIIALFSPYVQVEEVVQKNGFSFVNTRDPDGARRAKDALSGALLGGSPVRINIAMRRARDPSYENKGKSSRPTRGGTAGLPRDATGQVALDQVRDDRGNPATKNLFVAGYGNGTSERQLRQIFGQHAAVTGCVMKGSFSFVNTADKMSAITARDALTGSLLNGGVLRINFAKESGRLGTSFDTTYGPGANQSNQRYLNAPMH